MCIRDRYKKTRDAAKVLFKIMEQFNEQPKEEQVLEQARIKALKKQEQLNANKKTEQSKSSTNENGDGEDTMQTLDELMQRNAERIFDMTSDKSMMNYKPNLNDMSGKWGKMQIFKPHLNVNMQSKIKGGREY